MPCTPPRTRSSRARTGWSGSARGSGPDRRTPASIPGRPRRRAVSWPTWSGAGTPGAAVRRRTVRRRMGAGRGHARRQPRDWRDGLLRPALAVACAVFAIGVALAVPPLRAGLPPAQLGGGDHLPQQQRRSPGRGRIGQPDELVGRRYQSEQHFPAARPAAARRLTACPSSSSPSPSDEATKSATPSVPPASPVTSPASSSTSASPASSSTSPSRQHQHERPARPSSTATTTTTADQQPTTTTSATADTSATASTKTATRPRPPCRHEHHAAGQDGSQAPGPPRSRPPRRLRRSRRRPRLDRYELTPYELSRRSSGTQREQSRPTAPRPAPAASDRDAQPPGRRSTGTDHVTGRRPAPSGDTGSTG